MTITLVSSFVFREPEDSDESIQRNLDFFLSLEMPVCLFTTSAYYETWQNQVAGSHIQIQLFDISNAWVSKEIAETLALPRQRNEAKDTFSFLTSGHYKHEMMASVLESGSTHYAWLDFNISKIFGNKTGFRDFFQWTHRFLRTDKPFLAIPGCWSKLDKEKPQDVLDHVHWRFCGGFFVGDAQSIRDFCQLYRDTFPPFLKEHQTLVWDFNFWSWMETFYSERWNATWYKADHNDSIYLFSADHYTRVLENPILKKEYDYPKIDTYYPTSASYLFYRGEHWLNTRYVNYWIYPNGCYQFHNGKRLIENKNMLSTLDPETWEPIFYKEVVEDLSFSVTPDTISVGLEDIRLYEWENQVKCIAATTGYSPNGKSRMMVGDYDVDTGVIRHGRILQPPHNAESWCEKNWIPLIHGDKEQFIYKWNPLEIGRIDYETGEFVIEKIIPVSFPLFSKIKGSTVFYDVLSPRSMEDGLLGVVHFTEDYEPRHYYHMLILLDRDTYSVKNYSETFCFEKLGVEYCIGFTPYERHGLDIKYTFWISRHDRDPLMIQMAASEIRWMNHH